MGLRRISVKEMIDKLRSDLLRIIRTNATHAEAEHKYLKDVVDDLKDRVTYLEDELGLHLECGNSGLIHELSNFIVTTLPSIGKVDYVAQDDVFKLTSQYSRSYVVIHRKEIEHYYHNDPSGKALDVKIKYMLSNIGGL